MDKHTEKKLGLSFVRLLVEVKAGSKLPKKVMIKNEKGKVIVQKVTYDWKPSLCAHCHKYEYKKEECRKLVLKQQQGPQ